MFAGSMAARGLYLQDRVVEADEILADFKNEATAVEAEARRHGSQFRLKQWLTLEVVESDLGDQLETIKAVVLEACESVARACSYLYSIPVWVTILPASYESDFTDSRLGYFVPKGKYGKICLNSHLVHNLDELKSTTEHEFMHHISASLSHDHISHWLSEGLSTYAEGRNSEADRARFIAEPNLWLGPAALEGGIGIDSQAERGRKKVSMAYSQANLIVRHLVSLGPASKLLDLLKAIGDESLWVNLENDLLMRNRVDGALRHVYGVSESQLFTSALAWLPSA